jgi:hypothetical protein
MPHWAVKPPLEEMNDKVIEQVMKELNPISA